MRTYARNNKNDRRYKKEMIKKEGSVVHRGKKGSIYTFKNTELRDKFIKDNPHLF